MRKILNTLLALTVILAFSCQGSYLDKAPDSGLTEFEVFSRIENYKNFFETVYKGKNNANVRIGFNYYFATWDQKHGWDALSDQTDQARLLCHGIRAGAMGSKIDYFSTQSSRRPILYGMFKVIRVANISLEKMHMLQDATQEEKWDLKGQAFFVRAFAHFTLIKIWGGMPYLEKPLGADDTWDIPRLSSYESLMKCAADLDSAAYYLQKAGKMRRDNPTPGAPGHLDNPDLYKPSGVAAKALKGRILLFAASPLNNKNGTKDWKKAAEANWEAIKTAEQYGYILLPLSQYKENFVGTYYTNEHLWTDPMGQITYNDYNAKWVHNGVFANAKGDISGDCPTQNTVDRFETKEGYPLRTEAERKSAVNAGVFKEQDPYANRDPRFYIDIIYNTAPIPGYETAKIYFENVGGVTKYAELWDQSYAGITHTGYYMRKIWGEQSVKNQIKPLITDPVIRLAELYLNYAEAANEAFGPNGAVAGASMTSVQAVNKIRNRARMPDVKSEYTVSTTALRPRIKNERIVELCFEGFQYFDLRRWKDAPDVYSGKLYGVSIEKVPVDDSYPTGYKYTRVELDANRQPAWKDAMYYFPFPTADINKMKAFTPNEVW